jgi:hypothetical protein
MEANLHVPEIHKDDRGMIETLLKNVKIDSVLYIVSKSGSRRANHYHKTSSHWCVLTSGSMDYYERPVGSADKPEYREIRPWEVFYTGRMVQHLMVFKEDSVMFCFATNNRAQEDYENDLVRLDFQLDEV